MKNFVARGDALQFTAAGDISSGDVVVVEALIGIAAGNIEAGSQGVINITGIYEVPKAGSEAWEIGAAIYWDVGNGEATTADNGNLPMGFAAGAVGSSAAETLGKVRLTPSVPAPASE